METLVAFVKGTIPKEDTLFGAKLKFTTVVGAKVRPTSTAKNFQESIVREFIKQLFEWCLHIQYSSRQPIDQEESSGKRITPKPKRHRGMSKKCKTSFYYVTVLALNSTILLMCMWA
jgi:hypothetical protein